MVHVTCPICKKEKHTRGQRHFTCCNELHSIAKNINNKEVIFSEDNDLNDFECECGTKITKNQEVCTGCGLELDWP